VTPAGEKLRARMMERLGQPPPGVAALSAEEQRTLTKLLQRILEGNRQRTDGER
jgi:hypothetical protein